MSRQRTSVNSDAFAADSVAAYAGDRGNSHQSTAPAAGREDTADRLAPVASPTTERSPRASPTRSDRERGASGGDDVQQSTTSPEGGSMHTAMPVADAARLPSRSGLARPLPALPQSRRPMSDPAPTTVARSAGAAVRALRPLPHVPDRPPPAHSSPHREHEPAPLIASTSVLRTAAGARGTAADSNQDGNCGGRSDPSPAHDGGPRPGRVPTPYRRRATSHRPPAPRVGRRCGCPLRWLPMTRRRCCGDGTRHSCSRQRAHERKVVFRPAYTPAGDVHATASDARRGWLPVRRSGRGAEGPGRRTRRRARQSRAVNGTSRRARVPRAAAPHPTECGPAPPEAVCATNGCVACHCCSNYVCACLHVVVCRLHIRNARICKCKVMRNAGGLVCRILGGSLSQCTRCGGDSQLRGRRRK